MCVCPIYSALRCPFLCPFFNCSIPALIHRYTRTPFHYETKPFRTAMHWKCIKASALLMCVCTHQNYSLTQTQTHMNKYSAIWFFSSNVLFLSRHRRHGFYFTFFVSLFVKRFGKNEMAKQEKDLASIATTTTIIIIDFVTISFCHCSVFVVSIE